MSEFAVIEKATNKILAAYFCSQDCDDEKNTPDGCYRIPLTANHPLRCGIDSSANYRVKNGQVVRKDG